MSWDSSDYKQLKMIKEELDSIVIELSQHNEFMEQLISVLNDILVKMDR